MNRSLSRAILNQGGIKRELGGKFTEGDEVASLYDRTGNMAVARTLADYKVKAQEGMKGKVYGKRNEQGRVYESAQDEANQKAREGSKTDPFQIALREAELANAGKGPGQFMYDTGDGRGMQPYAIGVGTTANAGSGGAAGAGGGDVGVDFSDFDAEMDAWQPEIDESITGGGAEENGLNWLQRNQGNIRAGLGDVAEGYGNVWPHLANIRDYNQLPGITAPMLQKSVPLKDPNLESYKQAILAQGRNMQNQAAYDTSQSAGQAGQRAAALAKTQGELSRLAGYEGNLKADLANKSTLANAQITGRNLQKVNQYYGDVTERDLYKVRGVANERNRIAQNMLGFIGGQRQRTLDKENMALVKQQYAANDYLGRAIQDAVEREDWTAVEALQSGNRIA